MEWNGIRHHDLFGSLYLFWVVGYICDIAHYPKFKRTTGLSKENFQKISTSVSLFIQQDKENHPAKRRG
jgi:hypothetical protein